MGQALEYLATAGRMISLFAVAVIVTGFAMAAWGYARRFKTRTQKENFEEFRVQLAQTLLVGLEILVLTAVIETITITPTFQSLAILLVVILVRVAVSWNLELSITGRWPWAAPTEERKDA